MRVLFIACILLAGCGPSTYERRVAALQQQCDYGSPSACIGLQDAYAMRRQAILAMMPR